MSKYIFRRLKDGLVYYICVSNHFLLWIVENEKKTNTIKLVFDAFPHSIHRRTKTCRLIFSIVCEWLVYSWIVISASVKYKKGCTRLAVASHTIYQLLAHGRWFSSGIPASSTTKTGRHDIAEILLKVALYTINQSIDQSLNPSAKLASSCSLPYNIQILLTWDQITMFICSHIQS
jgi:hypothetical protein